MKKSKLKNLAAVGAFSLFAGLLAGCGGDDAGNVVENVVEDNDVEDVVNIDDTKEDVPARDLGGREIVIGNWWGDYDTDYFEPQNSQQEATLEMRRAAEERYNFRIREVQLGGWDEMQEIASTSIMAGDPEADIFILEPGWFAALNNQGLFYPVSDVVDFRDTSRIRWNQAIADATTIGNDTFGWATAADEGGGVWFNMRLFEEAGLDPELPFDLQASGEWTWDAFMDIARQLTRDTNNDGTIDTWAMATFSNDILGRALASNNAMYVGRDPETGDFYRATGTPEFLEALTFVNNLHEEGLLMPQPEGSDWNWFDEAFALANVAMRTGAPYMAGAHINEGLADDWGFVVFPKGPNADTYRFMGTHNIFAVPSTMSSEEVCDLMFAFQLWVDTPEGFEDPNLWMNTAFLNFRHPRSVEESLVIARDSSLHSMAYNAFIPGLNVGDIAWQMWHEGSDPAYIVEAVEQAWDAIIADANN